MNASANAFGDQLNQHALEIQTIQSLGGWNVPSAPEDGARHAQDSSSRLR